MTINERFAELLKFKNISVKEAAKMIGKSEGYVRKLMVPEQSFGLEPVKAILNSITDVNVSWLLNGEGEMLKTGLPVNNSGCGVPYYEDIEITGSILSMAQDYPEVPSFYIDYEHFNDCTAYLPVVGDSMYPQYCSGEIIAVKQVTNLDVIQWGEAYFIVTNDHCNNLRTIKQLHPHEDENKLVLRASNPNFRGDTTISKSDILALFIIKGKIKRNQL